MAKKGIAGRGVLIDWYRWATEKAGKTIDAMSQYPIKFSELEETATYQGFSLEQLQPGDIVFIRSGYIAQYQAMTMERREYLHRLYQQQKPDNIGVEPSKELLELLWNKKVAAVAGDSRSFEVWPCTNKEYQLHQWLLAGWAMPIGELFDLEELSSACADSGRYTFFVTSAPNNVSSSRLLCHHGKGPISDPR
jgi:kynurenine formamidase